MSREERSPPPTDTATATTATTTSSRTHDPAASSSHRRAPSPQPEASTSTGITRRRRRESEPGPQPQAEEEPMSKRVRRRSVGSSSEGDTEKNPTPPPTQKKKRTRTLTTPHQSAVLHALLAQSRFPTTAMREEVGRSIGLSARKVQIWFQNQRQKARRPRSQSDIPLTRPPQYGPFPSTSHPLPPSFPPHYGYPPGPAPPPPPPYFEPSSSSLLGPGMPGRSFPPPQQQSPFRYSRLQEPYAPPPPSPPPPSLSRRLDYSRTLPPLSFPGAGSSSSSPRPSSAPFRLFRGASPAQFRGASPGQFRGGSPAPLPTRSYHRSPSPERILPLPIQWGPGEGPPPPPAFGGTWARPSSGSGTVLSPVHARRYSYSLDEPPALPTPPPAPAPTPRRSGRYDPVRGTIIPSEPTPPPPEEQDRS